MKRFLLLIFILGQTLSPCFAKTGPTLLIDKRADQNMFIYGIGPSVKYKRVSAPNDFGGDMAIWGARMFAGKMRDPALGLVYQAGTLNGNSMKFNLEMGGFTLEDSFREDSRVKWRASFGVGNYKLRTLASGLVLNKGSFTFFEPMVVGVLPLSRHIVLEFSTGYTFAAGNGVRIEGLALQWELLFGKL
ncbi:MAG: hypothetical protein AB1403_06800 [Candidatus Riflebacteria bacterium]